MGVKKFARSMINSIAIVIGPEQALKLEAKLRFGKNININDPKTLSDKICYIEFKTNNALIAKCSDKYEVRKYVKDKGLEEILVPLINDVYTNENDIDFEKLPQKFALKATYGCQMNLIVDDKDQLDIEKTKKTIHGWLTRGFNRDRLEPHYKNIKKRIIIEEFLENANNIKDYKIHCINGKPEFILVCSERKKGLKLNLYDLQWNPIYEIKGKHFNNDEISRPAKLKEMIQIASLLCKDFDFVRVDLYEIGGKVFFGELTFTPDGGMLSYYTEAFDVEMGKKLKISRC